MRFGAQPFFSNTGTAPRPRLLPICLLALSGWLGIFSEPFAQAIEARHWEGKTAVTRQPEHVVAGTIAEWRSLWSRVGLKPPEGFEQGRTSAVGIFLGRRNGMDYAVNILSTSRRRDRIVVVFEERMPPDIMLAQRVTPAPPPSRPLPSTPSFSGAAGFVAPGTVPTVPPPPPRPTGPSTSPWAIVLINRADLPVSVEQRMFR